MSLHHTQDQTVSPEQKIRIAIWDLAQQMYEEDDRVGVKFTRRPPDLRIRYAKKAAARMGYDPKLIDR